MIFLIDVAVVELCRTERGAVPESLKQISCQTMCQVASWADLAEVGVRKRCTAAPMICQSSWDHANAMKPQTEIRRAASRIRGDVIWHIK